VNRRVRAQRVAGGVAAGLLTTASAAAATAECGADLPPAARQVVSSSAMTLAFAPRTWPLAVGRHFAVDIVLCAPPGNAVPPLTGIDAEMPAHRHGMNYRASLVGHGSGRYTAQGLMFHMPGRWRFLFDVNGTRLAHEVELE